MFCILSTFIGIAFPIIILEIILRFLPVNEATYRLPVNEYNPILRFYPNRNFIWSKGFNFKIINRVKTNNMGFVSNIDYNKYDTSPLIAIIGDSYVESIMVPFDKTVSGRLATHLYNAGRVYSFGISGAPLSQYLAYSEYVYNTFHPDGMVIVIVGNDFDESLKRYKSIPGYHYFVENSNAELVLERVDFSPNIAKILFRESALFRYIGINLELQGRIQYLRRILERKDEKDLFSGNTSSHADHTRIIYSKRVVDYFLKILPNMSNISPMQIAFVIDGIRPHIYDNKDLKASEGSFFDIMRHYFIESATIKGYEVIDMQTIMLDHYKKFGKRFEYPNDAHWNALGHELCFNAITRSAVFSKIFSKPANTDQ
jgi:hypothetical protein